MQQLACRGWHSDLPARSIQIRPLRMSCQRTVTAGVPKRKPERGIHFGHRALVHCPTIDPTPPRDPARARPFFFGVPFFMAHHDAAARRARTIAVWLV